MINKKNIPGKNTRILIWHRSAGIADLIQVLSAGMIHFKFQPFTLVIGKLDSFLEKNQPYYTQLYREICGAFRLCKEMKVINLSDPEIRKYISHLNSQKVNYYYIPDEGLNLHGRLDNYTNAIDVLNNFKKYLSPPVDEQFKNKCAQGKTRVFSMLRKLTRPFQILPEIEKWRRFICWGAERYNLTFLVLYDSNPESPYRIKPDELKGLEQPGKIELIELSGDYRSFNKTLYAMLHSHIHCCTASGLNFTAFKLSKPSICFDWFDARIYECQGPYREAPSLYCINQRIQKRYFLTQTLDHMKARFTSFIQDTYPLYEDSPEFHRLSFEMADQDLNNELQKFLFSIPGNRRFPGLGQWHFYDQAYYQIGFAYMKNDNPAEAARLLKKSDHYAPPDGYQLFRLGRFFKDKLYYPQAIDYLEKSIKWAEMPHVNRIDVQVSAHFHIGEIYMILKKNNDAKEFLTRCLQLNPDHKKAAQYLNQIVNPGTVK